MGLLISNLLIKIMDFSWAEKQINFKQSVIDFAQKNLNENIIERDYKGKFSHNNWQKCADFGIQGMYMPEAYSGRPQTDIMT